MKFFNWSPTRLFKYEDCPLSAKLEYLDKLCPHCFKGKLIGYEKPTCNKCNVEHKPGPALVRGSRIGASLERFVLGIDDELDKEIKNPLVIGIAKKLRLVKMKAKKKVEVELMVELDAGWKIPGLTAPWFRGKLDVLHRFSKKAWDVIDWKTGGIDKHTGEIRAQAKYDDQLELYSVATLSKYPDPSQTHCSLVFVDAPKNPVVTRPEADLKRKDLGKAQKKWEKRVLPMLSDETFGPRPSADACRFCSYRRDKGGPCPV